MEKLETKLFEAAAQGSITSLQKLLKDDDPLILDRDLVNRFNETPLHVAAMLGHVDFVKEIVRLKPQLVNEVNSQRSSPLHLASSKGQVDVVKALLSVDSRTCLGRNRNGLTPLHQATIRGRVEAMKVLLEASPEAARLKAYRDDESILHLCVKHYQLEALKLLMKILENSELIQEIMEHLETKLFEAAAQGSNTSLQKLLKDDDPLILDRGLVNRFNETPLHVAAMLGHVDFVKEIVRLKPQLVNEVNLQLSTPLHMASSKGHVDVVKALLSVDSRTCLARDRNGLTPLHRAAVRGWVEAMKVLIQASPQAAWFKAYRDDESILHLCVKHYQLEALKLLMEVLENSELINSRDAHGNTVRHLAVADKQVETIKYLVSVAALEVTAVNHEGLTALNFLIRSRRDVRDSEIERTLKSVGGFGRFENDPVEKNEDSASTPPGEKKSWESLIKQHSSWLERKKSALMVVASLIATMAFQIGVNPPGGVWQDDKSVDEQGNRLLYPHVAGSSVYADKYPEGYTQFYIANAASFVASLSVILLLTSGLPIRQRFFMWILMVTTWISITAIALCYVYVIFMLTPDSHPGSVFNVIVVVMIVWGILMALLLIAHTIRMIVKLLKKLRKAWMRRRRPAVPRGEGPQKN